jgi:hypothetical protein
MAGLPERENQIQEDEMKVVKLGLIILAALMTFGVMGVANAFHSGGVAECEGCHSMHSPKTGGSFLLIGTDASSTCLSCHQGASDTGPSSYHVSTIDSKLTAGPPLQRPPGGDFGWVKKTYNYSYTSGGVTTNYSETGGGHNIVAVDFNYVVDPKNAKAPGGTFSSSQLSCASCHDPHGRGRRLSDGTYATTGAPIIGSGSYDTSATPVAGQAVGIYRLLGSPAYEGSEFKTYPIAVAPSSYNRTEGSFQTRVAYGHKGSDTWGNWCATCHPGMHSKGYVHPVDETLGSDVANKYNAYVKSGDMTGNSGSSFLSLVPFAENTGDFTTLKSHAKNNDTYLNGPATSDKVMCLSCHRAHASGFSHSLRFDQGYEFMVKDGKYIGSDNPAIGTTGRGPLQSRGRTIADWQAAYYDRDASKFATYQRALCNKCHAKD